MSKTIFVFVLTVLIYVFQETKSEEEATLLASLENDPYGHFSGISVSSLASGKVVDGQVVERKSSSDIVTNENGKITRTHYGN